MVFLGYGLKKMRLNLKFYCRLRLTTAYSFQTGILFALKVAGFAAMDKFFINFAILFDWRRE